MRTRILAGVLTLAVLAAPGAAAAQARGGSTVVIAGATDLRAMNSLVAAETYTVEFINHVLFMTLLRYTPDLEFEPSLARSWRLIGDTAVVFNLRKDIYWHDGRRTTAHDVAFTFERARDSLTAFPNAEYLRHYRAATVIDSFTIRFSFAPHRDPLMVWPELAIMPRHLLESVPPEEMRQAAFNKQPVGNGPYRFVSQRTNDRWVFEANPRHPAELGGPPRVQRLIWRVIPDNTAQQSELLTGGADIILAVRAEEFRALDARAGFSGILKPSRRFYFIAWNGRRTTLADAATRRALMHALDRNRMIQVLRGGYATLATGPIAPYHWAHDSSLEPLAHDPQQAMRLLESAGWRDRNNDGVRENSAGVPLEIELKIPANNGFNRDLAEMIRSDLARVGVKVIARPVDFATLVDDISSPERRFDAAILAFDTDFNINLRDPFHSQEMNGPFQSASYRNARVDVLLDSVAKTLDRARARRLYAELQRILRDEQPWGFLFYPPELIVKNDRVQGTTFDIRGVLADVGKWHTTSGRAATARD